jgi:nucleoprotein TPR
MRCPTDIPNTRELTISQFKVDTLTQQLQLAQSEVERTSSELSSKVEEFAKYRRTRHAEITQLQAQYDALQQTHSRTESTLKSLQSSHATQTNQLTAALAQVEDFKAKVAEQDARYSSEAAGLRRLVTMMEDREASMKVIVDNYENEWRKAGEAQERKEAVLRDEIERERLRAEDAEKRMEQLEKVFDKMDRGELPFPSVISGVPHTPGTPGTPRQGGTPDVFTQGIMGLSPTVAMASRAQRSGKTFTEVYADHIKLQEDFAKKTFEYEQMERTLTQVLGQIEERVRMILRMT